MKMVSCTLKQSVFTAGLVAGSLLYAAVQKPNIVLIYADDLGYGDISCQGATKLKTPNIDKLAKEGLRFTDAHSSSSVCTPSRYGLLTGRYAWRTRLQQQVIKYGAPLIAEDRVTVASLLKEQGYHTAGFGKWHLGLQYKLPGDETVLEKEVSAFPLGTRFVSGPVERGFNQYYWFKLFWKKRSEKDSNWTMIENDKVVEKIPLDAMLPRLVERGKAYIAERAKSTSPFFMYFAPPVPHTPIAPSSEWKGKSTLGSYADYVMQLDAAVGTLMETLDAHNLADNTLVVFSSDNGMAPYVGVKKLEKKGHYPSGQYRGYKSDIWDGGHRVPFIVRWPKKIKADSTTEQLTCQTDFIATVADLIGVEKESESEWGEDSVSMLPVLLNQKKVDRDPIVHHSLFGRFALRKEKWKLNFCPGSGGWTSPQDKAALQKELPLVQLYNLETDPGETKNLQSEHPEIVSEMTKIMESIIEKGRSTPGDKAKNDVGVVLMKDK